ncbi:MAG TPA: hypothetical protein VF950_20335 [Planctomycetota bacterium]
MIGLLLALVPQDENAFWDAVLERVKPLWIAKSDPAPFVPPPAAELEALAAFAAGPLDAPLPPALDRAGWRVDWIPFGEEKLRLLRESPDAKRGRGVMLTRPAAAASKLVLMAPHRFFDKLTGDVARAAFFRARASVLLENTAHRLWNKADDAEHGPSDAAHQEATGLHALARGVAAGRKGLLIVQPHGSGGGEDGLASAILSDGTRDPGRWVKTAAERLRASNVRCEVYGVDTRKLGATENVLGRHLRTSGADARFLHVEMTLPLREAFKADAAALADALRAAAE